MEGRLPFVFEASGSETHFTNGFDPDPARPHGVRIPQPGDPRPGPARCGGRPRTPRPGGARSATCPPWTTAALRPAQITAINGHRAVPGRAAVRPVPGADGHRRGQDVHRGHRARTGCSSTAASSRVLFLVDRNNLGRPDAARSSRTTRTPDDGRRFTELYNVDKLTGAGMVGSSAGRDLHDPARLRGAARPGGPRRRRPEPGRLRPRRAGRRRLQPGPAAGGVRPGHRGRGPPLDLRGVAGGARVLRRPHRRADRDAGEADVRVLPAEPRLGVHLPAVGGRPGQRRLRRLPDPHRDHRAGRHHRGRHRRPQVGPAHPRQRLRDARGGPRRTPTSQLDRAVTATATRSASSSRRSGTGCSPRSSPAARRSRRR